MITWHPLIILSPISHFKLLTIKLLPFNSHQEESSQLSQESSPGHFSKRIEHNTDTLASHSTHSIETNASDSIHYIPSLPSDSTLDLPMNHMCFHAIYVGRDDDFLFEESFRAYMKEHALVPEDANIYPLLVTQLTGGNSASALAAASAGGSVTLNDSIQQQQQQQENGTQGMTDSMDAQTAAAANQSSMGLDMNSIATIIAANQELDAVLRSNGRLPTDPHRWRRYLQNALPVFLVLYIIVGLALLKWVFPPSFVYLIGFLVIMFALFGLLFVVDDDY